MSWHPKEEVAMQEHSEKLNLFTETGYPATNAHVATLSASMKPKPTEHEICICSQSTSTTVKGHNFIITTTLLCENRERAKA